MKPTILIDRNVHRKIMYWVDKSSVEVSGFGLIKQLPDGILRVTEAFLLPQKNTGTSTDIEPEDVAKAMGKYMDHEDSMQFHWHSHVNMGVFMSVTDRDTMNQLSRAGWFVMTVFNKKNEVFSCVQIKDGIKTPWGNAPLYIDNLETKIQPESNDETAQWDTEYTENCTQKTYQYSGSYSPQHERWLERNKEIAAANNAKALLDMSQPPPDKRPENISKREFKSWKKLYRTKTDVASLSVNEYGFTPEEMGTFAQMGWDNFDIDEMINHDFAPEEVLELATNGNTPQEIRGLIAQNYSIHTIMSFLDWDDTKEELTYADEEAMWNGYTRGGRHAQ